METQTQKIIISEEERKSQLKVSPLVAVGDQIKPPPPFKRKVVLQDHLRPRPTEPVKGWDDRFNAGSSTSVMQVD